MRRNIAQPLTFALLSALLLAAVVAGGGGDAYRFPLLLAGFMCALSLVMLARAFYAGGDAAKSDKPFRAIVACVVIFSVYLAALEQAGFYLSSWLACSAVAIVYDAPEKRFGARAIGVNTVIAALFTAVLYLLFSAGLRVQTPRGIFF